MEKEITQAIKEDKLYDFIANHYWEIKPEILKDLILEIYYMLRYERLEETEESIEMFKENLIYSLMQNRDWEE